MIPTVITDHLEAATARFISQFRSPKPVLHGLLASYVEQLQILEDVLWDVINHRLLDPAPGESVGAEGVQLDVLGKIVGQPRLGLSDVAYRLAIKLKIRVNRSRGSSEDLLEILRLAMPDPKVFTYTELYHLASYIYVEEISVELAFTVLTSLNHARAAGYRAILEYSTDRIDPADLFRWEDEVAGGVGVGGFGDDGEASGGLLTSMQG
jgi:hypothetical protein